MGYKLHRAFFHQFLLAGVLLRLKWTISCPELKFKVGNNLSKIEKRNRASDNRKAH
jgi:hypothetical protein